MKQGKKLLMTLNSARKIDKEIHDENIIRNLALKCDINMKVMDQINIVILHNIKIIFCLPFLFIGRSWISVTGKQIEKEKTHEIYVTPRPLTCESETQMISHRHLDTIKPCCIIYTCAKKQSTRGR